METRRKRQSTRNIRNGKIIRRYNAILKRMGDVKYLTPQFEIMDEIAKEFDIGAETVSRIIKKLHKQK